jgi:hypothetical protein
MKMKNALLALIALLATQSFPKRAWSVEVIGSNLLQVDYRELVSRADLTYDTPVARSEEGMPVGNGRMGSLVWTEPTMLKFQINRVDVFAENSETHSFPERDSDYASGCGYLDINLADFGEDIFAGPSFRQHLSLYNGVMTAEGKDLTLRVIAWPHQDVMVIEVDDRRQVTEPVSVDLRMLRYALQYHHGQSYDLAKNHSLKYRIRSHTATSTLDIRDNRIYLIQEFSEDDYYNGSAVAVSVVGRETKAKYANDATVRLSAAPGQGKFTILIASASSFDQAEDSAELALEALKKAEAASFKELMSQTATWWHDFWARGFVYMHSSEGQADFVEQNYTYFIYLMAASSRGDFPPRFGGMLWRTTGDLSRWGAQHWWANTNAYYSNLMPANRLELMDPMFDMYTGMSESCARAAEQQWGSKGIWIPETVWFDGMENLPDDIAAEMRDLYLVRKPWEERSDRFKQFADTKLPHNPRWNWKAQGHWEKGKYVYQDKGSGPFGHTSHILGAGGRIAALSWQRYQYTMDESWLRERAYPLLKGTAEFYRNFPNFRKGNDGLYHIYHVNSGESDWNTADTPYELSVMNTVFPLAIRATEILETDPDLRAVWQEIRDHLPEAPQRSGRRLQYGAFVYGGPGDIAPIGEEPELKSRFLGFNRTGGFIDTSGIGGPKIFRNRLRLREGPGAIDAEHIGGLASGIHSTLLSSSPEAVDGDPLLTLFNDWPASWDAAFTLRARGAFVVSSVMEQGRIPFVEIESLAGSECRLRNPWKESDATLHRDGKGTQDLSGTVITFATVSGERLLIVPKGSTPLPRKIPLD